MNTTKRKKSAVKTLLTLVLTLSLCLSLLLPMGAFAAGGQLVLTDVSYDGGVRFTFDCSPDALYSMCQAGIGMTVNDEALTFNPNYSYHAYYSASGEFIKESGDNALYATAADFSEGDNTVVFTDPDGATTSYNVNKKTTTETVEYWYGTEEKTTYVFTFSEITGEQPVQPSTEPTSEPSADPEPETPSEPVDGTILYVRINGGFEHRIVGEEDIADATSSATGASYAVINEGNAADVQAALVPEGTAFADVEESAWTSLQWLSGETAVQADGGKCKAVISPAGSGMTADYDVVYGQVKLSGTPAQAGDYTVTLYFTDTEGRTAVSNSVAFKIYSGDETLSDQLVLDNCSQTADGKYIYDMEPWYIHDFGGDQSVIVPTDVKAWYGSHTRGTYGELGEIISLTNGDAPIQELVIPAGCNLTMVNMRVHSGVKIIVEDGATFSIRDTIIEGILEVQGGGTFSMDYNDYGEEAGFLFGSSINGQLQLLDGATISNARIVSHTNYSGRDDENRMNFAPVVSVTGSVNMVGDVYIAGDEAPNDGHGQPGLYVVNGTLNVPAGSTLAVFGGGNSMLTPEGGDAVILDNGTITGDGKLIAVGGYCANITSNESYGHGGAAVSGSGVISTADAYLEGGSSINTPAEPLKGDVTLSDSTNRNLVSGIVTDTPDTGTFWVGTGDQDGTIPVLENYPVPENAPGSELKITAQPEDFTGKVGSAVTFTVSAQGNGLTYQWQFSDNNGKTWKNSAANSAEYSTKLTSARDGRLVKCTVTDKDGNFLVSDTAVMRVYKLAITQQPKNYMGKVNSTASFSVEAQGDGLTYQWQISDNGGKKWTNSSVKDTEYSSRMSSSRIGRMVRCVVKDQYGNTVISDAVTMKLYKLTIVSQPENYVGKVNSYATFTVVAEGDGLTYQWQLSTNGGKTWKNSSVTDPVYTSKLSSTRDGRMLRCIVTDAYGTNVISDVATMTIG